MKSPFPGMDPYLERQWQDVHQRICTYASDQLQEQLGGDLVARLGQRLVVESMDQSRRPIYPDVRVIEEFEGGGAAQAVLVAEDVAEPMRLSLDSDPEPQAFVEITESATGRLITVIEILSASNKVRGAGRKLYKQKQRELRAAGVNLVEIDLLRGGRRAFLIPATNFPAKAAAPYYATILRAQRPSSLELYPILLRAALPALRIPLRRTDKDVILRLQPLIEQAYTNGRYDRTDYGVPCDSPLSGDDAVWARQMLEACLRK